MHPQKFLLSGSLALILVLSACAPAQVPPPSDQSNASSIEVPVSEAVSSASTIMVKSSSSAMTEHSSAAAQNSQSSATAQQSSPSVKIIQVTAQRWTFSPNVIRVKKGQKVTIVAYSLDVPHGFAAPDLGINETLTPGQRITFDLPTDRSGTFAFFCSIPCGAGHTTMRGQIIIEE
ncbi:cupredoxin domain-containing protein [Candidatus Peregrinibacteria bacterium]|nr:cupredoxin domain-containing protein [Candidatus Peregrinibacteria bacterium]